MKFYTFRTENKDRIGVMLRGYLIDLAVAYDVMAQIRGKSPDSIGCFPSTILGLLRAGPQAFQAARETLAFASKRPAVPVGLRLTYSLDEVSVLPPITSGNIFCRLGKGEEFFFQKAASAIVGPGAVIEMPDLEGNIDFEGRIAAVIGRRTKAIRELDILNQIAGYSILNDLSARSLCNSGQMTLGKNFDTFCPLGPCLATPDDLSETSALQCRQSVNGEIVGEGSLQEALPRLARAISILSAVMTLEPGDVVAVGLFGGTPISLKIGDTVALEIDGIGKLENRCAATPTTGG